jgi:hypothetical protein
VVPAGQAALGCSGFSVNSGFPDTPERTVPLGFRTIVRSKDRTVAVVCDARTPLPSPAPSRPRVLRTRNGPSFRAFALRPPLHYDISYSMPNQSLLLCDGCGQPASPEHIAKRLQRLEWTTRYRPVHIDALLVGAMAPKNDTEFFYAQDGEFAGEARIVLEAAGLSGSGKSALAEFQRGGFLLTHVLECPLEEGARNPAAIQAMLEARLPAVAARIRRSWRPKRLVLISQALESVLGRFERVDLGCSIVLDGAKPFALDGLAPDPVIARLRKVLATVGSPAR